MVAVVLGRVPEALEVREVRCVVVDVVERRVDIEQLDRKRILAERADDERLELAWAHHVSVLEHLVQPREDTIDVFMCLADRVAYRVGDLADDSLLVQVGHVRKRGFAPLRRDAVDLCAVGRDGGAGESIGCKSAVNQLFARGGPREDPPIDALTGRIQRKKDPRAAARARAGGGAGAALGSVWARPWQLEEMDGTDGPDAAGMATCRDGRRVTETVERLAAVEPGPEDTAILFRRNEEGRDFRRRAVAGELTPHDISRVPECFRALLKHLASPTSKITGLPVHCTDYESVIDGDGAPR